MDEEAPHNAVRVVEVQPARPVSPTVFGKGKRQQDPQVSASTIAVILATLLVLSWVSFVVHHLRCAPGPRLSFVGPVV